MQLVGSLPVVLDSLFMFSAAGQTVLTSDPEAGARIRLASLTRPVCRGPTLTGRRQLLMTQLATLTQAPCDEDEDEVPVVLC